jgi:hypothetical protein
LEGLHFIGIDQGICDFTDYGPDLVVVKLLINKEDDCSKPLRLQLVGFFHVKVEAARIVLYVPNVFNLH